MDSNKDTKHLKTPFDDLVTSTHLDIMKLLLPLIPANKQSHFAIYIKFQELQETARFFKKYPNGLHSCGLNNDIGSSDNVFDTIKPYLSKENSEMIDNISNMMHMIEMVKQMQEVTSMNEGDSSMDFLKNMLSPEQQEMFEAMNQMYDAQNFSTNECSPEQEGSDTYE